jgi:hypothetical protein
MRGGMNCLLNAETLSWRTVKLLIERLCAIFTGSTEGGDGKLARRLDMQFEAASDAVVSNHTTCRAPALASTHGTGIGRGSTAATQSAASVAVA